MFLCLARLLMLTSLDSIYVAACGCGSFIIIAGQVKPSSLMGLSSFIPSYCGWARGCFLGRGCLWIRLLWTFWCTSWAEHLSTLLLEQQTHVVSWWRYVPLIRVHPASWVLCNHFVFSLISMKNDVSTSSSTLGIFSAFLFNHPKWYPLWFYIAFPWQSVMLSPLCHSTGHFASPCEMSPWPCLLCLFDWLFLSFPLII